MRSYIQPRQIDGGFLVATKKSQVSASLALLWELCTLKLDEEKSKHTGLTQQKTFGPAFLHCCLRQVKGTAECHLRERGEP
jgi:hypothetical protein